MPDKTYIYLRYPDGREQPIVAGAAGERVAKQEEAERGAVRFVPDEPYVAQDPVRVAQATSRAAIRAAREERERAEAPATEPKAPAKETKK